MLTSPKCFDDGQSWITCVCGLLGLSISGLFAVALVSVFVVGFGVTLHNVTANALIQSLVPDQMRGRMVSIFYALRIGLDALGGLIAGLVAAAFGAPLSLSIMAAVLAVCCGWLATRYNGLRAGVASEYRIQADRVQRRTNP
jgi:MFS family permease